MAQHEERVHNAFLGLGFHTNESLGVPPGVRITGFGLIFGNGSLAGGEWTLEEAISQMEDDEEIFAVWGEADDWLDGWDIFSIQTLEGTPRKGKKGLQQDPANILKEFLKKNPECSKYFDEVAKRINRQNMFGTQISMYGETGPSMVFHDARKFPDRTLASFGVTSNDKNKKLSEIGDPTTAAYTDDDTNQVFLFDRYYAQSRNEQGVILVHESLHEFLSQGNHVELARALGLRFFTLPGDSLEVYAMNQQGASEAITQFIRDGCRK